ncbi:MAG: TetR/AcrR family transcriptional regulator C-terminal domain-containing protein [Eubacteriales bacterium]|jgi:probable dihydroxyacetone kinase regulator
MNGPQVTPYKIAEALKKRMESKSLEKITVTEILEEAQVSRPTFYRYFKDKYDLVNWYFQKLCDKSFLQMGISMNLREALTKKFIFLKSEQVFFEAAFACEAQNNLVEYDYECIYRFYSDYIRKQGEVEFTPEIEFLLKMYCRGSIDMTADWARNGMTIRPEQIVGWLIEAMPEKLHDLFRNLE